jgi:hypothetical protein
MPITGGSVTQGGSPTNASDTVELSISISGGKTYKRLYPDVVESAINKFVVINSMLGEILKAKASQTNIDFYIEQSKLLLRRAHVELVPGNNSFQNKYNMWLLDGYVRMLLETVDIKLIAQLLDLDSILYSMVECEDRFGVNAVIDFDIPSDVHALVIKPTGTISYPIADDLTSYLYSFRSNINLLSQMVTENVKAFTALYKQIILAVSKRFEKNK